ncbi:DASH complex subunit Dad3-domain-containing protein [Kockovaella imperatae]|uniref:DASH complex subunit DAD3 n=1 Tax=Kockovaella imperatae TaxID=4999 RepID=A0A1Y1UUC1_9TREE|nr:DASH complex subunit Dad3-domain-containing protein [Kockovaella imperatae]ORX40785.1 DASH complex subunit Dad3-domain-containing protein [Kockovaella imperatae]
MSKNPYANNSQLSSLEQEVLWEYVKLSDKIKRISNLAKETAETPNESLLTELRDLEKKMGLVLTLFKASVWTVVNDREAELAAKVAQEQAGRYQPQDYEEEDSLEQEWR